MAQQIINTGNTANDGTGDPLRTAFTKVNNNFTEVYNTSNGAFNRANIALQTSQSSYNAINLITTNAEFQFIEITGTHDPSGNIVSFTRPANTNLTDIISSGVVLARANIIGGIYNAVSENVWNELVSPANTGWNWSGWDNITNVKSRQYRTFKEALKNRIGNNIIGAELVMHDITNDNYYKIKFTEWSQQQGGGFAYTRELINTDNKAGIYFPDGSVQYTSPGDFDWPFIDIHDVSYTIRLSDIDRTIYSFDNTIYIPRDSDVNFPLGSAIYLVTGTASVTVERVQHIGETEAQLFVSGQVPSVASVVLPQRSINILFKAAPNTWYLAPWSPSSNNNSITGNISISATNSEINFVANSSGDGAGYSTIELRPDTNTTSDQYIIIDPTAPSHIHVRAGGIQDQSGADLFLGGEKNYVRVSDGSGVRVQSELLVDNYYYYSDPAEFTLGSWYEQSGTYYVQFTTTNSQMQGHAFDFNNDTDNNELIVYHSGGSSNTLTSAGSVSNLGGNVYRVSVNEAPPTNPLSLTNIEFHLFTTRTSSLELNGNDLTISVQDDVRITARDTFSLRNESATASISIITNYDGSDKEWEFGADGRLTFPQNGSMQVENIDANNLELSGNITSYHIDTATQRIQKDLSFNDVFFVDLAQLDILINNTPQIVYTARQNTRSSKILFQYEGGDDGQGNPSESQISEILLIKKESTNNVFINVTNLSTETLPFITFDASISNTGNIQVTAISTTNSNGYIVVIANEIPTINGILSVITR